MVGASPEIGFYNLAQSSERMLDSRTGHCPRFLLTFSCLTPALMAVDPHLLDKLDSFSERSLPYVSNGKMAVRAVFNCEFL